MVRDDRAELQTVHDLVETAFAEHFGHSDGRTFDQWIAMWRRREGFDLDLWWIAEVDGGPAAALLGQTLDGAGHVGTLGTLPHARARGLGTLLLRTSFAQFHDRGYRRVSLGVDSENATGAVRLYESVGMHASADWALYELPPLSD
jgi:ribosomal protein S18 acetylase RimI-like enzyme